MDNPMGTQMGSWRLPGTAWPGLCGPGGVRHGSFIENADQFDAEFFSAELRVLNWFHHPPNQHRPCHWVGGWNLKWCRESVWVLGLVNGFIWVWDQNRQPFNCYFLVVNHPVLALDPWARSKPSFGAPLEPWKSKWVFFGENGDLNQIGDHSRTTR